MTWVIVKESFITKKNMGEFSPRKLSNGQYLLRVTEGNEDILIGLKRYSAEGLLLMDLESPKMFKEKEETVHELYQAPFSSKTLPTGEKLYRRGRGFEFQVVAGFNNLEITSPYKCKINQIEFINSLLGESVDLFVLDTANGDLTGVPKYALNQFGFSVYLPDGRYVDHSKYDAEIETGMIINLKYNALSARTLFINIPFHELK